MPSVSCRPAKPSMPERHAWRILLLQKLLPLVLSVTRHEEQMAASTRGTKAGLEWQSEAPWETDPFFHWDATKTALARAARSQWLSAAVAFLYSREKPLGTRICQSTVGQAVPEQLPSAVPRTSLQVLLQGHGCELLCLERSCGREVAVSSVASFWMLGSFSTEGGCGAHACRAVQDTHRDHPRMSERGNCLPRDAVGSRAGMRSKGNQGEMQSKHKL